MTGILNALIAGVSGAVKDAYFNLVSLLLPGNGTNGAQNNTFLDSSTNNFTITRNGNTTQGTFSPFSQTGWGNYFDGTANGSLRADSTTDTNLSGDFTIQAWVYPTANGQSSNTEIIGRGAAAVSNGWHFGLIASTTQPFFGVNYATTGNNATSTQSSTNIPLNQWTHVAVTRSGNTCRIYINGVVDTTNTGFTGTPTVSGTEYVYVGRGSYDSTNRQFTGYINNASIIKGTALTTFSQTQPLATDTSGQALLTCTTNRFIDTNTATTAKTLTAGSGASVVAFSPFAPTAAYTTAAVGGSGYFDGTGDYLEAATNAAFSLASTAFTIEAWVYFNATSLKTIMTTYGSGTTGWTLQTNASNVMTFNASGDGADITGTKTLTTGQWYHVAVSGTAGSSIKMFINGEQDGSTYTGNISDSSSSLLIGQIAGSNFFNGYISGLRIVKGTAVYTSNFTPPTAPLTAITNTSLLLNFTNAGITDATAKNDLETVGNAQISTSVSKFGGGSIAFNASANTYLSQNPATTDLYAFGSGDFTIECWLYLSSTTGIQTLYDGRPNGSANAAVPTIYITSGSIRYFVNAADRITGSTLSSGQWYHIAIARSGGSTRMFIGGTQAGSTYTDSTVYLNSANRPFIGGDSNSPNNNLLNGYIDDLRITKGYARYTANFTAPTAPFPVQ